MKNTEATETVLVTMSGLLWDRVVDSISTEHGSQYGRGLDMWSWRKVGFGHQASAEMPVTEARQVLSYLESIGKLDGSGMDPEGAADTRAEARAARTAASALRLRIG